MEAILGRLSPQDTFLNIVGRTRHMKHSIIELLGGETHEILLAKNVQSAAFKGQNSEAKQLQYNYGVIETD